MRRFLIVVEKAASNSSAYSPDLPGVYRYWCHSEETKAKLPREIVIQRYDPKTGQPAGTETYRPEGFLPTK
jgi:hypothetical protein